ncbi:E3 ubiquitin-protein ligase HERC1 [Pelomyxa schiedti]|nr:E3 ubiquitin-protein ligase HERC1 [Pelomyxa schiedti]
MEVCHTAGILDSFLPAAAATNSSYKRQLAEIWAKQFIESLDHGPQLLKAGSKADCDKMAKALVSDQGYAGTVLVIPAPTEATDKTSTDLRKAKLQRNNVRQEKGLYQSAQPRYGCSTAMSVASECVSLLRMLLSLQKVSSIGGGIWSTECTNLITSGMLEITPDVKYTQAESIQRGVAALAVCGGFAETLRVGGHVVISQPTATLHNKTGVVTHYTFGSSKAQVLVEGDASKISQEVDVIHLKPAPETPFVPDMLHMTPKILNHLMLLVVNIHKNAVIDLATVHTIQLYATRAVANALRDMTVQDMLFESELHSSYIAHLVECTLKGTPGRKLAELENSLMCLSERMWELSPPLHVDYQEQGMSALLPYAICPQKNELLPMSCYGGKLLGVTFRSEDFCSFEYSGVKTGRVGDPEALVMSPVPIPMDCDYYYEVTLDVADTSSILNIGLCPEGASGWGNNSYRFQGDAKKTWFSNGQRQRSNYGVPVSSKCTIGCHWSSKEKCISYTKDGKLLGPAFKHVPSMPKLVPAIGIGRGIRANVNFGSRPFKYQVSGSGSAVVLDSVAQAKKEAEDIARLEKELREEAERKKTAWLAEKKAQTDACQQLMRMGFTKEQCLFALINSGFNFSEKPKNGSMLDLVGNWMLEHIGNVSDDDLAACMAEMKKNDDEKAKEFDTTGEKTKPPSESQNKPQTSSTSVPPEITLQQCLDSFSPSESGKYQLADLYSFNDESAAFAIINKIDPWWEDEGLPEIRMFLEHDNRPAFELEENMMLLRNKLTAGKEAEVLGLILRLTSENLSYVPLIQKRFSSGAATKSIKLSQARTGATVLVSTALVDSLPTHPMWMEEMSSTLGQQGVVKFLEPREKLVLLQFHNSETAMTTEWWYPLTHLEPVALNDEFSSRSQTIQQLISEHGNLISHYSRNAILQLVAHPRIQLCLPPLELPSLLKLVSFELLDSQQSLTEPVQASVTPSSSPLSLFKGKLMTILESDTSFSKLLLGACVSTINRETTMTATKVVISPPTGGALNAEQVSFPDANEITVVFDRTCTLSSGNKAKLSIYSDEICTKLLHRYTEKDLLFPLRFRANTLFIKMETDHNPENLKYKVACIPSTFQVGLALWLADLLLDDAAKFTDIHEVCEELFTAALKYVYVSSVPFPAKEIFFNLIKKILRIANARDYVLPIQHLDRLGEEMVSLYGSDRRVTRPGLHTTYFQSLIELALISKQVWSMLPEEVRASLTPPPPVTPTPATPTEKTDSQSSVISPTVMQMSIAEATTAALASAALAASTPKTSDPILPSNLFGVKVSPDQDDTALAVALTKTLRDSVEKLEPDGADEGSEQPVDDDFALAIALSLQSVEEPKSKDDSQEPKETKDPEKAPDAQDIPSSPETMESPAVGESSSSSSSQEESAAATPGSSPANTTSPKEAEIPEVPKLMEVDASQVSNTTTPSTVPVVSTPTEAVVPQDDKKTEVSESLPKEQTTTPSPTSAESSIPPPPPPPPSSSSLKESMTGIKIGLKPQKAPFSSVANSSWFTEVTELYFFAQYLSGKVPHDSPQMLPIWKKCYEASTKETIKERIVCVEGLPTVPEESAGDIGGLLFKIFRVHCKLWGGPDWRECIWLPVDADTHKTMGYAFVEVLCSEKVKDVVRKINKTKLPEPHNSSTLKVTRFRPDLEQSNDPRVSAYCMSKLITRSKELTSPASSALETLFSIFGKQFPGMITLQELDALQLAGAGKHFTDDELAVIRKDKDLKQLAENPETFGIPLNSFKQLYINSAMVAPVETMDELFKLGFDFHLYPDHFMSVDDAVAAMSKWERSTDRLLIEIVESTYQEKEVPSPTSLPADMLLPSFGDLHKVQAPIPVTRFRFTLLKLFNSYVTAVFPLLQPSSSVPKLTTSTLASPTSAAASTTSSKLEQIESFCDLSSAVFSCGNLIFPKSKTIFFFDVLEKTGSTCPQPALAINRLKLAASKTKAASEGEEPSLRYTMFRAAFNKLRNTHPALLRCRKPAGEHHTAIKLTFRGENVEGEGGPYRQFFTEVAQELQTQYSTSLFITCPTTHMKFIPRPSFTSSEHLEMYRLVGRMMGIAVRTGIYFSLYLPAFVWKSLLDVPATLEDFGEIDESLEKGLKYVKQCSDEECADLNDLFTTVLSDKTQVELVPQGAMIALTPENRKQYLQLVEQVRLKEFAQQSQAMRQGLLDILPDRLLRILTPAELEWRVCGQPAIDVALLKACFNLLSGTT